jgi:hypothetical protein
MKKRHSNPVPPGVQAEIDALAALQEDKVNSETSMSSQNNISAIALKRFSRADAARTVIIWQKFFKSTPRTRILGLYWPH